MSDAKVGVQTLISPQVDFRKWKTAPSIYRNSVLYADNGNSATYVLGPNTTQTVTFTLPTANNVVNLSRMILAFQVDLPASGANITHWVSRNPGVSIINQVKLTTQKNHALVDIADTQFYLKMVTPLRMSAGDLQSHDKKDGIEPSNSATNVNCTNITGLRSYTEMKYMEASGLNTVFSETYLFRFAALKDTIFGIDRSIYFGENLTLRLTLGPGARVSFLGSSTADPTAGAAVTTFNTTVSAVQMYVPIESSDDVINSVKGAYASSGITCLMPYLRTGTTYVSPGGTRQTYTQKFTVGDGKFLQRIYHGLFGAETLNTTYDHNNLLGAKYTSYFWQIAGKRQTEYDVRCGTYYEDYIHAQEYAKGSAGTQSAGIFQKNAVIVADYTHAKTPSESKGPVPEENIASGLDLSTELKFDFTATCVDVSYTHRMFAVCQRMLQISPAGVWSE